eukprot:5196221-Pyramimonas_sp.AAC.1
MPPHHPFRHTPHTFRRRIGRIHYGSSHPGASKPFLRGRAETSFLTAPAGGRAEARGPHVFPFPCAATRSRRDTSLTVHF